MGINVVEHRVYWNQTVKDVNLLVAHEDLFLIKFGHIGIQIVKITNGLLDIPMGGNREAKGTTGRVYIPTVFDTKKKPFSVIEIPKNGIKQGILRSGATSKSLAFCVQLCYCRLALL